MKWPLRVRVEGVSVPVYRYMDAYFVTRYQVPFYGALGVRKMKTFTDLGDAKKYAKDLAESLAEGDAGASLVAPGEAASLRRAQELLPSGISLELAVSTLAEAHRLTNGHVLEAARAWSKVHPIDLPTVTVEQAVADFLEAKKTAGASERYLQDLRYRLGRLARDFNMNLADVTANQIQLWLDGLKLGAQSYTNFRRAVATLIGYCKRRGWLASAEDLERIEKRKVRRTEVAIYTVAEATKLLAAAPKGFRPCLAIMLFAGLRSSEVERLSWLDVKLADRVIVAAGRKHGTPSRRVVDMHDNLAAWLKPHVKKAGRVWPGRHDAFYDTQQETATAAKLEWKHNAARHSFGSYLLAMTGDAAKVANQMGNSPAVVHSSYKALATKREAEAWFRIVP